MKYHYNPPSVIKSLFKSFYWETTNNKILLTFDDGPNPGTTEMILKTLNELNLKAIFFCVGNNNKKYLSLTNSILNENHNVGNHTFNHIVITKINSEQALGEINRFNTLMKTDFNYEVEYFRPPHGKINLSSKKLIIESRLKCVMWNLLTYDYQNNFEKVKYSVDKYLRPDSIVVLHDSEKSKSIISDSIKYIYDQAVKRGYRFGVANECLN